MTVDSTSQGPPTRRGTTLLLAAAILWSTNGLLIKSLHAAGMGGPSIACYRSMLAAAVLVPFALRGWRPLVEPVWVLATVLAFTGMTATFVLATTLTTAANAIMLQYTAPAWVFLLSPWIVRERAAPRHWAAFSVSMAAVAFIFVMQYGSELVGLLIGLLSGLVFGTQIVLFRRVRANDPVVLAFLCCTGSALILLPVALRYEGFQLNASNFWLIALTGIAQFGLPYVLYSAGVRETSAQDGALIIMLEPVLNPLWVFLFYAETPHWSTTVGGAAILLSVCYLSLPRR